MPRHCASRCKTTVPRTPRSKREVPVTLVCDLELGHRKAHEGEAHGTRIAWTDDAAVSARF